MLESISPDRVLNIAFKPENYSLICPCEKINVYSTPFYPSADLIVSRKRSECMSLMKQYSM